VKTGTGTVNSLSRVTPAGVVTPLYSTSTFTITAGPLVGAQDDVYVAVSGGTMRSSLLKNPGPSEVPYCSSDPVTWSYQGDLALSRPGPSETLLAVRTDGFVVPGNPSCPAATIAAGVNGVPTVIVVGTTGFVTDNGNASVSKFTNVGSTPAAAGSTSTVTLLPANLYSVGVNIVGGGGPTAGGVFAFDGVALPSMTTNATAGSPGGPAVVGGSGASPVVFWGDNAGVVRSQAMTLTPSFVGSPTASGVLNSPPTKFGKFAQAVGVGGRLYVLGRDGVVRQLNSSSLTEDWQWGSGILPSGSDTALSQLNLDINRDSAMPCAAGQSGVLYVSGTSSNVTTLYALYVDSQGVDRNAPWPRYQHDPANTGNAATSLTPWSCP
jgi:hypothetical protein